MDSAGFSLADGSSFLAAGAAPVGAAMTGGALSGLAGAPPRLPPADRGRDEELARRFVAEGDRRAFEELVLAHLPAIRRFLAARLRDPAAVEEAEQEVLLRFHASLPSWKGESSLRTWLFSVCRTATRELARLQARESARRQRLFLVHRDAEPRDSDRADWQAAREAEGALVRAALARLGEPAASLVYLRDAEGLGVDELASIFGLREGTVKSRLSRARVRLRLLLEAEGLGSSGGETAAKEACDEEE